VPKPAVPLLSKLYFTRGHTSHCGRRLLVQKVQVTLRAGYEYHTAPEFNFNPVR
jgi:hypothetical protein